MTVKIWNVYYPYAGIKMVMLYSASSWYMLYSVDLEILKIKKKVMTG